MANPNALEREVRRPCKNAIAVPRDKAIIPDCISHIMGHISTLETTLRGKSCDSAPLKRSGLLIVFLIKLPAAQWVCFRTPIRIFSRNGIMMISQMTPPLSSQLSDFGVSVRRTHWDLHRAVGSGFWRGVRTHAAWLAGVDTSFRPGPECSTPAGPVSTLMQSVRVQWRPSAFVTGRRSMSCWPSQ
jgi:hypothetical protein